MGQQRLAWPERGGWQRRGKVLATSWQGRGKVVATLWQGRGNVVATSWQGRGKVAATLLQIRTGPIRPAGVPSLLRSIDDSTLFLREANYDSVGNRHRRPGTHG